MTDEEADKIIEKITEGVKLAIKRLVEQTKKEDGELVISRNGKVVQIKARELPDEPKIEDEKPEGKSES